MGNNHRSLPRLLRTAIVERRDYAEFMIHSPELMPGGSPNFPTARTIEVLYETLEGLFALARRDFTGRTLSEYFERFTAGGPAAGAPHGHAQGAVAAVVESSPHYA
jgi:hypothetical protein